MLVFAVNDGRHGDELWQTDGSRPGTHLVFDVWPGRAGSFPHELTPFGQGLLFAADDGRHGDEVWIAR